MDLLAGEAEVGDGRSIVPLGNIAHTVAARRLNLTSFLRRIVFVGEPALGIRFDFDSVGRRGEGGAGPHEGRSGHRQGS